MSIFNIFRKKTSDENISPVISKNSTIKDIQLLFQTPPDKRDALWIEEFNISIKKYGFKKTNPEIYEDRTGMSYLNFTLDNQENEGVEKHIEYCLQNGNGISINGIQQHSDWTFTYGELLDYYINGSFYTNQISKPFIGNVIDKYFYNQETTIGQPSDFFLPKAARIQIKSLLKSFGLENIKIALIWFRQDNRLTFAFDIVPEMFLNPTDDSLKSLLHFIKWYLPNHYETIFVKGNEDFELL
jgi:hypothetical protein